MDYGLRIMDLDYRLWIRLCISGLEENGGEWKGNGRGMEGEWKGNGSRTARK
jgi:hypothetical protein